MQGQEFTLPVWFDLVAVGVFAVSGAAAAVRRGYDLIGTCALALVTALGGSIIRDGVFLHPEKIGFVADGRYLMAVGCGALMVIPFYRLIQRLETPLLTIDAIGLAVYTAVGSQKALAAGIALPGVILIGVINGVGGGIIRDVLTRQEPLLFKPGQYYAAAAIVGSVTFVGLHVLDVVPPVPSLAGIGVTFALRMAAVKFNWQTTPLGAGVRAWRWRVRGEMFREGGGGTGGEPKD